MNPALAVEALAVTTGAFRLGALDFALAPDEILVMLGPNGAGKSVALETIAGFHRPDAGRVLINGRDVTALPPERRHVGMVVQNFGLFPHLTVAQNVALARRPAHAAPPPATGLPAPGDTAAWLAYFGVTHLAARTPQDLSPGEKQRVALARTLASAPDVFLFDEPFSALDALTRDQLREELLAFLRKLAIPAIFVTHDHNDAQRLADRIVVLRAGALVQNGPAHEIFRKPKNAFVARFLGVENILPARMTGMVAGLATLAVGSRTLRAAATSIAPTPERPALLAVRADDVAVIRPDDDRPVPAAVNRFDGAIAGLRPLGPLVTVEIDCGFPLKACLLAREARALAIGVGCPVRVHIAADAIHVMSD